MTTSNDGRYGQGTGPLAVAIVVAALILGFAPRDGEPRYQIVATDTAVYRMDTDSGAVIACDASRCTQVQQPDRAQAVGAARKMLPGGSDQTQPAQ